MEAKINELKQVIKDTEESLKDPSITSDADLTSLLQEELDKAKKELAELESKTSVVVEKAEEALTEAKDAGDKKAEKKAKKALDDAEKKKSDIEEVKDGLESVEGKVEKVVKKQHGGAGRGQGRKPKADKVVRDKTAHGGAGRGQGRKPKVKPAPVEVKPARMIAPPIKKAVKKTINKPTVKSSSKEKSLTAFGQKLTYKNESELCKKLIGAFKKRRSVYKEKKVKTKPVFGVITAKVGDAVKKSISNITPTQASKNPKQVIAHLRNIEKKGKLFLESFKPILGSDYKHSEIGKEFDELEKTIQKFIEKYKK